MKLRTEKLVKLSKADLIKEVIRLEDLVKVIQKENNDTIKMLSEANTAKRKLTNEVEQLFAEIDRMNGDINMMNKELCDSRLTINEALRYLVDK